MGIAIIFRKQLAINLFRDFLINSIKTKTGDSALICSGFFQENFKKSTYQASNELNFANEIVNANIKLTTVGIHNNAWLTSYRNFKSNMLSKGVNINCLYKTGMRWHAKVYILSKNEKPIFGIIGSSNFTKNAFGVIQNFNYECDVLLWDKTNTILNTWIEEMINTNDLPYNIIKASYSDDMNSNLSIPDRLEEIKKEILNQNLKSI